MHIFHVFVSSLLLYILNTTKGNYPTNGLEESVVLALFRSTNYSSKNIYYTSLGDLKYETKYDYVPFSKYLEFLFPICFSSLRNLLLILYVFVI